ncbi:MAG: hypothetical protein EOP85_10910 [Verrucomicrobiaceae bacterium]|nr:MAG: hypothetical protein EOP85_10910 [Verrucomicrobiaceae bacterium]
MKFGLLLSTVLFLSGMLGWSGIPEVLAYRVVESPEVRVPTEHGWTSFSGSLLVTKRHLLVYHPVVREPVGGAITQKGRIEVFERISLRKLGEVLPDPAMESGAGSVFVANDTHLAVRDKGVAIYDLHGLKLVRRIAAPKGSEDGYFADRLTVAGSHLLIHEPGADKPATDCGVVHVHDFATGKLLGKLTPGTEGAGFGNQEFEVSGDGRFLLYQEAREYPRTPKDLFAADLKFPSTIVKVGELPFLKPFQSRPRVELLGKHLMISETYGAKPVKHMYDLSTRKRLYSVTGAGDWNGCAVRKNLLFVPKPDRSPSASSTASIMAGGT